MYIYIYIYTHTYLLISIYSLIPLEGDPKRGILPQSHLEATIIIIMIIIII